MKKWIENMVDELVLTVQAILLIAAIPLMIIVFFAIMSLFIEIDMSVEGTYKGWQAFAESQKRNKE